MEGTSESALLEWLGAAVYWTGVALFGLYPIGFALATRGADFITMWGRSPLSNALLAASTVAWMGLGGDLLFFSPWRSTTALSTEVLLLFIAWRLHKVVLDPRPRLASIPAQTGKLVLVTGGAGIGFEAVKLLALKGADVVLAARDVRKGMQAAGEINAACGEPRATFIQLDLASLKNIAPFVSSFKAVFPNRKIDVFYVNAGFGPLKFKKSPQGFEEGFATMHLAHHLLFKELLPCLETNCRVVTTASVGHTALTSPDDLFADVTEPGEKKQNILFYYGRSKLANLLFAKHIPVLYPWLRAYAFHPGAVKTGIWKYPRFIPFVNLLKNVISRAQTAAGRKPVNESVFDFWTWVVMKSPVEGAYDQIYLATTSEALENGGYYMQGRPAKPLLRSRLSYSSDLAAKLWEKSEEWIKSSQGK